MRSKLGRTLRQFDEVKRRTRDKFLAPKIGESSIRNPWNCDRMSKIAKESEWQWEGQKTQNHLVRQMPLRPNCETEI